VLIAVVGGIGFTVSLFVAQLAFPRGHLLHMVNLAILVGPRCRVGSGLIARRGA
jgi:Na+/H+ antiporter NhaA